jgi:prephenate dehydrogenase
MGFSMKAQVVTVIGLDRIGASIGLAIRASEQGLEVVGYDRDREVGQRAKEIGAVDSLDWNLVNAASAADILVLSVPLSEMEAVLKRIGKDVQAHTLVLDVSSLKGPGLKLAETHLKQGHYVGVSPVLAATALTDGRFNIEGARTDLFAQSVFCIMPSVTAEPKAVETAVNFGRLLGATPFFLDPDEFDSLIQGVETSPGLLSAAMFRAVTKSTGWRDILRFTSLPFALATASLNNPDLVQLAFYDKDATLRWLDEILHELQEVRRLVAEGDRERVELIFEDLEVSRARWLHERAKNDWTEDAAPANLKDFSFSGHLLGAFGRRGREDKS